MTDEKLAEILKLLLEISAKLDEVNDKLGWIENNTSRISGM